jgi:alkylation response protein AidB-like acyl-CoA dehydrogenase
MADFPHVQGRVGEAVAALNAGTALILSDLAETERMADAGEPITVDRRIHNRLSQAYIVKLAVQGVDTLYAATGGAGLYLSDRLQRAWRDVHGVAHHVSFNWDAVSSMYGQHAYGLEPRGQY